MTASLPYVDARTLHRNTPDWLVTVRTDAGAQVHRFTSEETAWTFYNDNRDDETPEPPALRGIGSRA